MSYDVPKNMPADGAVEALAEMAAGVAHELNNPLSVIAGRITGPWSRSPLPCELTPNSAYLPSIRSNS